MYVFKTTCKFKITTIIQETFLNIRLMQCRRSCWRCVSCYLSFENISDFYSFGDGSEADLRDG